MAEKGAPGLMLLGLNHRVAPIMLREGLAVSGERLQTSLRELFSHLTGSERIEDAGQDPNIRLENNLELVLLSTCNRHEVYLSTSDPCQMKERLVSWLANRAGLSIQKMGGVIYCLENEAAAQHLMRVAAGLDSLVVGENEIQGQVREAYEAARQNGVAGAYLSALFQAAVRSGKRVRCETELGHARRSVASMVVDLAREIFGDLQSHTALIIGAGKVSTLAARALVQAGLHCVLVANRTYPRACKLAQSLGAANARAVHFDALVQVLYQADIVICSTSAPHMVLHEEMVAQVMRERPDRMLLVADLALPRDVDPRIGLLPGVRLANIDDLEQLVLLHYPLAAEVRCTAEDIVQQEFQRYNNWLNARRVAPLIRALQSQAQTICEQQVALTLRRMGPLSPNQEHQLRIMADAIASHLLHEPIDKLKAAAHEQPETDELQRNELSQLVEMLFGLSDTG